MLPEEASGRKRLRSVRRGRKFIDREGHFLEERTGIFLVHHTAFFFGHAVFGCLNPVFGAILSALILKESGLDYTDAFYYPMGENPIGALEQIEKYCINNNKPLLFCCSDNATAAEFSSRYNNVQITNNRDWSDYIYEAEKFKTYAGNKLSGQRNHVN